MRKFIVKILLIEESRVPQEPPLPPPSHQKKKDKKAAVGQGRRPMVRKFLDERSSENRKPNVT